MFTYTFIDNEKKHVDAVLKAMETNGEINRTIIQGIFVGPARSGKNCLMNRLLQRIPSRVSPSTGVADSVIQVSCGTKGESVSPAVAQIDGSTWTVMDDDDQAVDFMQIVAKNEGQISNRSLCTMESSKPILFQTYSVENSHKVAEEGVAENITPGDLFVDHVIPSVAISPDTPKSIFSNAIKKKGLSDSLMRVKKSLYLTNTGGQVEFQDVLPLLVSGPSIFFYTFRLDKDLNDKYEVCYAYSDDTESLYMSSLTTLEGIIQTLASIDAMITYIYQGHQKRKVKPKVFFIGTHKDKLDRHLREETLKSINQKLWDAVSPFRRVIEFASKEWLIFTVNNFSESDSDFHAIRLRVHSLMNRKHYIMTFPVNWLAFGFILKRLKAQIITFDQCFNELAKQNGINTKEELKEVLYFLHSRTGIIRYFPYSGIDSIVIIHPQFLFDKVTELIIGTFTLENTDHDIQENFKCNGIFSLADLQDITDTDPLFSHNLFGKMLETLRIAAPFTENGDRKYFLPCVLGHADHAQVKESNTSVPILLVAFKCGYCPKGVPCALIKYLMTNEMNSSFLWDLIPDEIFRDQASFLVGPYDTVVLRNCTTHIEIVCIPDLQFNQRKITVKETCSEVRKAIEAGVSQVLCDMFYVETQLFFTFPCVLQNCNRHPAQLLYHEHEPTTLYCKKLKERFPLPKNHEIWCLGTLPSIQPTEKLEKIIEQLSGYASEWYVIGIQLGFSPDELDNLKASPILQEEAPQSWLKDMLYKWFHSCDSTAKANLDDLKTALASQLVNLGAVAQDLNF